MGQERTHFAPDDLFDKGEHDEQVQFGFEFWNEQTRPGDIQDELLNQSVKKRTPGRPQAS